MAACYIETRPAGFISFKAAAEYRKSWKPPVKTSFAKLLFARECNGRFGPNIKITTFFNDAKGKVETRNYFF